MVGRGYNIRKSFRMHMSDKISIIAYRDGDSIHQRIRLRASP